MFHPCRAAFLIAFAISHALASSAPAQTPAPPAAPTDWLRFVPGDVRFYVEVHDLVGLRRRLQILGIWHTVRQLADHDRSTTTQPQSRLPGLDDEQAISQLIGRRGALFAPKSAEWQSGVLFAEAGSPAEVQRWRVQWGARRLADEGAVQCYLLDGQLRMAVLDNLMVLGPARDETNLWGRTVQLMAGRAGPNLRGQSEFASLRARLTGEHDGIGYVAWEKGDPFALAGCERMLFGFSLDESRLRCEIYGHRPKSKDKPIECDAAIIDRLPADTMAAWSDSFTIPTAGEEGDSVVQLDDYSPMGIFLGMFGSTTAEGEKLAENLGPRFTVAVCPDLAKDTQSTLKTPTLVLAMEARKTAVVAEQLEHIFDFVSMVARFAMVKPSEPLQEFGTERRKIENEDVRIVPLGRVLAERFELPLLRPIEICWAAMPEHLVFATSTARMQSVLQSWHGDAPGIGRSAVLGAADEAGEPAVQWGLLRGSKVSSMMRNWLHYIGQEHPEALRDEWWQDWAAERSRKRTKLGVTLKNSPTVKGGAEVLEIDASSPAAGLLQIGDVILAAGGRPLATSQPALETAKRYNERGRQKLFRLTVLRAGRRITFGVAVESLDLSALDQLEPIRALRQLIVLLRRAELIRLVRRGAMAEWLHVSVSVEWNNAGVAASRPAP